MNNPANGAPRKPRGWRWWYLLLIAQFIPVLWVPLYNQIDPKILGVPFFYWFQLLLVLMGAIVTAFVYFITERD